MRKLNYSGEKMALFIMLVGIPGSGKSTLAETLAQKYQAAVISTDQLRYLITGNEADQSKDNLVFAAAHQKIREMLMDDHNIIYDATNITPKDRKRILNLLPAGTVKKCYYKKIGLRTALIRNAHRKRVVPEKIISKMYNHLQPPVLAEGWDEIQVIEEP